MLPDKELKNRDIYLNRLIAFQDTEPVKVITGVRRCGKSKLLDLMIRHLKNSGISEEQIIKMNFESHDFDGFDYNVFYNYVKQRCLPEKRMYLFFDELQRIDGWENAVNAFRIDLNCDIYITGSNAYLLSSEYSTYLSGRYVEIKMLPFSFKEYVEAQDGKNTDSLFAEYMRCGSFPYIASMLDKDEKADTYIEGIYNTVIIKDIEERQARKEKTTDKRKITDITLLKNIAKYLASVIGSPVSVKSIADYIASSGRKVSQNTVSDYIEALTEAFIFYSAERYDVYGKQLLKQNAKYYIVDLGLRRYLLSKRNYDLGYSLENIVYLELLRRGFTVNVGKIGNQEVDFIVKKGDLIEYIQVSASLTEQSTFDREISPLRQIKDNYPKTILTLDKFTLGNYDGIEVKNVLDWLLEK